MGKESSPAAATSAKDSRLQGAFVYTGSGKKQVTRFPHTSLGVCPPSSVPRISQGGCGRLSLICRIGVSQSKTAPLEQQLCAPKARALQVAHTACS